MPRVPLGIIEPENILKNAKHSSKLAEITRELQRLELIRELKEDGFSRDYLIEHGFATQREYEEATGESSRNRMQTRLAEAAELMHQVVGAEVERKY